MKLKIKRLKYACYTTNLSMAVVANLSPLLFLTFRSLYNISYSALGTLVLVNFVTQLTVDLLFSFFSHKMNISKLVKLTPVVTAAGLFIYALYPFLFPKSVYIGLIIGTVIFAASGGMAEVLISPVIAALPSENPDRDMSRLHSVYAWGVVGVVAVSTLFLFLFGKEHWQWLACIWLVLPILSCLLFAGTGIPEMASPGKSSKVLKLIFSKNFILYFACIFLGGASENIMSQWSSSYLEQAFHLPKLWVDLFGVAMFAVALGLGRTLYAKYGKRLNVILFAGSLTAFFCYLAAALSNLPIIGLIACAVTGFAVSMLWPGSLTLASNRFPAGGLAVFALMAAGGDLGGSIGPQMVGIITDTVLKSEALTAWGAGIGLSAEQTGMKTALFVAAVFPLSAAVLYGVMLKKKPKRATLVPQQHV